MRSLSSDDVVSTEIVQIKVFVKYFKNFCGLVCSVGGHVDSRVDKIEFVVSSAESTFLHDFFLRYWVQVVFYWIIKNVILVSKESQEKVPEFSIEYDWSSFGCMIWTSTFRRTPLRISPAVLRKSSLWWVMGRTSWNWYSWVLAGDSGWK